MSESARLCFGLILHEQLTNIRERKQLAIDDELSFASIIGNFDHPFHVMTEVPETRNEGVEVNHASTLHPGDRW